jgi:5S rRNA maturation endonuclease (ribonuclease M5)
MSREGIANPKGFASPKRAVNSAQQSCLSFWSLLAPCRLRRFGGTEEKMKAIGRLALFEKAIAKLRGQWILVEGQRDRKALAELGMTNILTVSGNLVKSCDFLEKSGAQKAYVLTDLDRRGHELAKRAREELEARSIGADLEVRVAIARSLRIKNIENAKRAYERLKEDTEQEK